MFSEWGEQSSSWLEDLQKLLDYFCCVLIRISSDQIIEELLRLALILLLFYRILFYLWSLSGLSFKLSFPSDRYPLRSR